MTRLFGLSGVECRLVKPAVNLGRTGEALGGYFQAFFVRAQDPEEAERMVRLEALAASAEVIAVGSISEVSYAALPLRVLPTAIARREVGVIWRSGRIFYPNEGH